MSSTLFKGKIVLMGSGELTATMVQVHKDLLAEFPASPSAVFLDTPAGFQLNVDQLSERVTNYFTSHIQHPLSIASFKSSENILPVEAEQAFRRLRLADYILMGPGSPTYAVNQWRRSPVPEILMRRIEEGLCLVAASAAALTVGKFTLPVYEIYKVGQPLHWVEGMDLLGHFNLNWVVIPHWNNAEGGTHDTRFCYMGKSRFLELEALLPKDIGILGLDEHTACLIDFKNKDIRIRGIGGVTLRRQGMERKFHKGDPLPFEILLGKNIGPGDKPRDRDDASALLPESPVSDKHTQGSFWDSIHEIETAFHQGLKDDDSHGAANAMLAIDQIIWKAHQDREDPEFISQGREILREMMVLMGTRTGPAAANETHQLAPLVEELLALREKLRKNKSWAAADAIRDSLSAAGIIIEDTKAGTKWRITESAG